MKTKNPKSKFKKIRGNGEQATGNREDGNLNRNPNSQLIEDEVLDSHEGTPKRKLKLFPVKSSLFPSSIAKVGAISTIFVFGGIIFSGEADAFSLSGTFNQIVQQLSSQVSSAQNYLNQTASSSLQSLEKMTGVDVKQIMTNATGALGIPDPSVTNQNVAKSVQFPGQSSIDFSQSTIANVNGQITNQAASAVLSQSGQAQIAQESNNVSNAVTGSANNSQNVYQQSQNAVTAVSTQDVLKQIAQQNAELSQQQANLAAVNGSINTNLQRSVQAQNLGNINLANINSAVNGANQKGNMEIVGVGRENLKRASSSRLY